MIGTAGLWAVAAALILDRMFGDPDWLWSRVPHPVSLIGSLIGRLDRSLNHSDEPFAKRRRRGLAAVVLLSAAGAVSGALLYSLLTTLPFAIGMGLEVILASILLAQKSLLDHVWAVADSLDRGGLTSGRAAVARIVGRDVAVLDQPGVARAAIESAAENFSDGVVAPAFWYAVLGLPGLLVYKVANTADSMIGHRSPRHEAFGWAAARFDDLLNFVPARLSALLIGLAAALTSANPRQAFKAAWRDAPLHRSPNAGWPEAAAAGGLGLGLGGPRRYGVESVAGAWLNPEGKREAGAGDIRAAIRLIDGSWALMVFVVTALALWTEL